MVFFGVEKLANFNFTQVAYILSFTMREDVHNMSSKMHFYYG